MLFQSSLQLDRLHCFFSVLVLADVSFLTLFGVVVFGVSPLDVCWAGCSSFSFCIFPFVSASFPHY